MALETEMRTITFDECKMRAERNKLGINRITDSMICAYEEHTTPCYGDSGSPMVRR